jgi:hypothetical protein
VAVAAGAAEIHKSPAPGSRHFGGTKPKSSMISKRTLSHSDKYDFIGAAGSDRVDSLARPAGRELD